MLAVSSILSSLAVLLTLVWSAELPPGQCSYEQISERTIDINDVFVQNILFTNTDNPTIQQCFQECCNYPEAECTSLLHKGVLIGNNSSSTCYLLSCDPINSCSQTPSNASIPDMNSILTFLQVVHNPALNSSGAVIPLADVENFVNTFVLVFAGTLALAVGLIMLCLCLFLAYNFHKESQKITERKRLTADTKAQSFSYME